MKRMLPTQDRCFGCSACSNICPKQCIQMELNEYGELRPVVDEDACVNCGKCSGVCPALSSPTLRTPLDVYAMTLSNPDRKKGSASGGAARLLYEQAIKNGAVVYGCDFDEHHILRMKAARSLDDIEGFRNSKYTYCRMDNVFLEIRSLLKDNIPVMFVGSSCQVDALQRFLGDKCDGLLTVDLICHGVPPEQYFIEYWSKKERELKTQITSVRFRGDSREHDYYMQLFHGEEMVYDKYARCDDFFAGYVNYIMFEEKCYYCPYGTGKRISDITVGDWWGASGIKNGKLSLLFANSDKGKHVVEKLLELKEISSERHTFEEAVSSNEQLKGPAPLPENYTEMRECYRQHGFQVMSNEYIRPYIKRYQRKQKKDSLRRFTSLPIRALRKIKRMVKNE